MKKYKPIDDPKIKFLFGGRHQGYFYYKLNYYMKVYKNELESLKFVNDYKEENYPPRYYMDKGALEVLNVLLEEIKE